MLSRHWRTLIAVSFLALLALAATLLSSLFTPAPAVRHITLNMEQFAFSPGRLEVNRGDQVILDLTASDSVHGFYLEGYDINVRVEPGIAQRVVFTADRPGKFHYRCSVTCGPLHPFMIGELVVGPNIPLWAAIGVALVTLAAVVIFDRKTMSRSLERTEL